MPGWPSGARCPKLCRWVEENIDETLTFYGLPLSHHKHLKSTNLLDRLNDELKRRTLVVRVFPNAPRCLRLSRLSRWKCMKISMSRVHAVNSESRQPYPAIPSWREWFRIAAGRRQGRAKRAAGEP